MSETRLEERPPPATRGRRSFRNRDTQPDGEDETATAPSDARHISYWRSELLQAMFWLKEEGFGDQVDTRLLERFLGVDSYVGVQCLDRLVDEGSIERVGDRYKLSAVGAQKGKVEFVASFEEFMKPSRCGCGRESWRDTSFDKSRMVE